MSCDILIKGGSVIDGSGTPRFSADIAVDTGRIAEIGKINSSARRVIDAHGLAVAPGFIDPHTHYDAQICWDKQVTPSSWHGVTTVIMGSCGVGVAPASPETREAATWDLVNLESIPFDVLNDGLTWDWERFSQLHESGAASRMRH